MSGLKLALLAFVALATFALVGVGCTALGVVGGYANKAVEVVSVDHVSQTWDFAYHYNESLKAEAQQICTTEAQAAAATDPQEQSQRRTQVIAMSNNYSRIRAEYQARLNNVFEAKVVAPPDVPRNAPDLTTEKAAVCR